MTPLTANIPTSGRAVIGPLPVGSLVESVFIGAETSGDSFVAVAFHGRRPADTDADFARGDQAFIGSVQAWGAQVGFPLFRGGVGGGGGGWAEYSLRRVVADDSRFVSVKFSQAGNGPTVNGFASLRLASGVTAGATSEAAVPPPRRARRAKAEVMAPSVHADLVASVPRLGDESGPRPVAPAVPRLPPIPDVREVKPERFVRR